MQTKKSKGFDSKSAKDTKKNQMSLSNVIDQIEESIMVTDKNSVIEFVNNAFKNRGRHKEYEIIEKNQNLI